MFDKFCILSLTYWSDGSIMMLAPLRDYLSPKDPGSSPLLCTTKERYFARLSVDVDPDMPNFGEARWITSEDVNVEHLLDIFTTIDPNLDSVWDACAKFAHHLYWHKRRLTILQPKIEGLPDDHNFKPDCLYKISRLISSVGNYTECKRILTHTLKLWRERGNIEGVAQTLRDLSDVNRNMDLPEEGMQQVKEALEIYERLGDAGEQADCLLVLAFLLHNEERLDEAEEAAFHAIKLLPEKGNEYSVCQSHHILGRVYEYKGEIDRAIHHFELALGIASTFDWHDFPFWVHYHLAGLFRNEDRLEDAQAHVEHAKSHAADDTYFLTCVMEEQAWVWYMQHRLEEAKSEALRAADFYERLGAVRDLECCREFLREIEEELNGPVDSDCELP
jgi:tetratricopeptide (TPR) repeat protein